jgi:aspartyl-tRNA(Asn)/glutamyl-tRNA(Gln) amidotransferase subunit B
MTWETVIGLEIHAQLATRSKIFSGAATAYGAEPNTQADLVTLGYPGVLPVLNAGAVQMAVKFGLAIDAAITRRSVFARKNYFYPDLPKGYQISQYELPIVGKGHLDVLLEDGSIKRIGVTRAHLEEDAGKSMHEGHAGVSAIDLNRAGTPLLEIVSEPDMRSAKEAIAYMKKVHTLVRYLGICDGNMQEGSFRCDANVSVRRVGAEKFGTRAELKNLNSFRFVEKARLRGRSISSRAAARCCRKPACTTPTAMKRAPCVRRKKRTTTVISPIRICCPSCSKRASSRPSAQVCRSCRMRKRRVSRSNTGCLFTTPVC